MAAVATLAIFSGLKTWDLHQQHHRHELVFYHTRDNQAIDHIMGLQATLFTLDSLQDRSLMEYQIHPNRLASYLPQIDQARVINNQKIDSTKGLYPLVINEKKLLFLSDELPQIRVNIKCDYLVIGKNSVRQLKDLNALFEFDSLIISQSNSYYLTQDLEKQASELNLPYVSMKEESFTIKLNRID